MQRRNKMIFERSGEIEATIKDVFFFPPFLLILKDFFLYNSHSFKNKSWSSQKKRRGRKWIGGLNRRVKNMYSLSVTWQIIIITTLLFVWSKRWPSVTNNIESSFITEMVFKKKGKRKRVETFYWKVKVKQRQWFTTLDCKWLFLPLFSLYMIHISPSHFPLLHLLSYCLKGQNSIRSSFYIIDLVCYYL